MTGPDTNLAQWFAEIARDLQANRSVEGTLDQACRLAVASVDGCESAGVSLVQRNGRVETQAATDPLAKEVHDIQNELGEGPCVDAIWEQHILQIDDLTRETHWPRFLARVAGTGLRSTLSFQLFTHHDTLGALDMFSRQPKAFNADSRELGRILAAHAAVALADTREQANLSQAIASRQLIGEATGILSERHKLTTRDAFALLAQTSQNHNIKLRDLAARLVASEDGARPAAGA